MAATGHFGSVTKDSGTTPPAIAEESIAWDHSKPAILSKTQPDLPRTDQNLTPTTCQTILPHVDIDHSDPVFSRETVKPLNETTQTVDTSIHDDITPGLIDTNRERINRKLIDIKEGLTKSFAADSHDLAFGDHEVKGEAQKQPIIESGAQVRDLGWHKNIADMPGTLIGGVTNENLFAMIRRFNKVRNSISFTRR